MLKNSGNADRNSAAGCAANDASGGLAEWGIETAQAKRRVFNTWCWRMFAGASG